MAITLDWKTGFEIELMAPAGASRRDLAERVADRVPGTVRRFFHPQSEPSAVEGRPVFENLTPGFQVVDGQGRWIASFVDDLTLQRDLDRERPPLDGWRRIVADDGRLLRLVERHCDPDAVGDVTLEPLAALFGTRIVRHPSGMVRVADDRGRSVAIDAPLPGERERPCEIVTAPMEADHTEGLGRLLADARALGFFVPVEAATHVHFDAGPLCSAPAVAALVALWTRHGTALKRLVGANAQCVRLGDWPGELATLTASEAFPAMEWAAARAGLAGVEGLAKYCDLNLVNLINGRADKHTVEVRVLPGLLDADAIVAAAALFEGLLGWCRDAVRGEAVPLTLVELLIQSPMDEAARSLWLDRIRQENTAIAGAGRPYSRETDQSRNKP
ncbi:amidoligase family protein [Brevundimonas sp. AJA228-03]|uniref:amidoligase family protein n=1 Tax=Brevundimonas sp. AJA228-03 TaxID=2752515 RepID=UPI001AE0491D|nr:amidoligase family protein [Brevundimonas sp. AJA228-03]QTN18813.1 amidoligase family protein [Brevundimonas sp. AJA228-03]